MTQPSARLPSMVWYGLSIAGLNTWDNLTDVDKASIIINLSNNSSHPPKIFTPRSNHRLQPPPSSHLTHSAQIHEHNSDDLAQFQAAFHAFCVGNHNNDIDHSILEVSDYKTVMNPYVPLWHKDYLREYNKGCQKHQVTSTDCCHCHHPRSLVPSEIGGQHVAERAGSLLLRGNFQTISYNNHCDYKSCKLVKLQQAISMEAKKFLLNHMDNSVSSYVKQSFFSNH